MFTPSRADIDETHDRWLEREPGIWERARWDETACTLTLELRGPKSETSMQLAWLPPQRWDDLLREAGFEIEECYGWFDRRPYDGHEDSVWIVRRPAE